MNIRIISEEKTESPTEKLLAIATEYSGRFQSVRRGATKSQREQGAKADASPGALLAELGVRPPSGNDNIMKNVKEVISGFINGKKSKELKSIFGQPDFAKDSLGKLGVYVPLTKIAMDAVRIDSTAAAREFAFWLHSVVWASHRTASILGDYAKSTTRQRLRVDFGQSGFIIYFSLNSWNQE